MVPVGACGAGVCMLKCPPVWGKDPQASQSSSLPQYASGDLSSTLKFVHLASLLASCPLPPFCTSLRSTMHSTWSWTAWLLWLYYILYYLLSGGGANHYQRRIDPGPGTGSHFKTCQSWAQSLGIGLRIFDNGATEITIVSSNLPPFHSGPPLSESLFRKSIYLL